MNSWTQWVGALFGGHPSPSRAAAPPCGVDVRRSSPSACVTPVAAATPSAEAAAGVDTLAAFFGWLAGPGSVRPVPLSPPEQRLLRQLDSVLSNDAARAGLLPRTPAVVPQLMNSLRGGRHSVQTLAQHVAKDANLVAEVIRLASSVHSSADRPVADLADAIRRLGTDGLRQVIAKVVLKPIFDAPAHSLSGRAAPRLWVHAEAQARAGIELAAASGLDPFEAFVAALMHNSGWSAALRVIDRAEGGAPAHFSEAFVRACDARRELFFARLVRPWQLNAQLTLLADALLHGRAMADAGPLGQLLGVADRTATRTVVPHREEALSSPTV